MTPAERARQIDKQEFESDCQAARERAFAYAEQCRQQERQKLCEWMGKGDDAPSQFITTTHARHHTYNGLTLTVEQWAKRLGLQSPALYARQRKLGSMIAAISAGSKRHTGARHGIRG